MHGWLFWPQATCSNSVNWEHDSDMTTQMKATKAYKSEPVIVKDLHLIKKQIHVTVRNSTDSPVETVINYLTCNFQCFSHSTTCPVPAPPKFSGSFKKKHLKPDSSHPWCFWTIQGRPSHLAGVRPRGAPPCRGVGCDGHHPVAAEGEGHRPDQAWPDRMAGPSTRNGVQTDSPSIPKQMHF